MQENYEIISDIKSLLAKQYNRKTKDIIRKEIIMHLPNGENWEKVLLLNRNESSTETVNAIDTDSLMNVDGKIVLNENEKIKLFALKLKLNNISDISTVTVTDAKYKFNIGNVKKNIIQKDESIRKNLKFAIECLSNNLLYSSPQTISVALSNCVTTYMPEDDIYQTLNTGSESEKLQAKKDYFKDRIKSILLEQNSAIETKLYSQLKDSL
jgi:hypothetical protein